MEKMQEMCTKSLGELKNKQTDEKYTRRNQQQNNGGQRTDQWPGGQNGGNPCHRVKYRKKNEKKWKQPKTKKDLWANIKCTGIHKRVSEEKKEGPEEIFEEVRAENFPNVGKEIVNQVQEAHSVPGRITQGGTHRDT